MLSRSTFPWCLAALLVLAAGAWQPAAAQTYGNKPGAAAAQFLRIPPTARGASLGQALVAGVADASATYYNPSGLLHLDGYDAVLGYTRFPADVNFAFVGLGGRLSGADAFGVSVLSMQTDPMVVRTVLQPQGTGETFRSVNLAVGVTYARYLTDRLRAGVTGRLLWMNLVTGLFDARGWSADLGIQYETGLGGVLSGLVIGMTVTGFGPEITYIRESYGLPLTYNVGVTKSVGLSEAGRLVGDLTWSKAMDASERAHLGLEYVFRDHFALRLGYQFDEDTAQSWAGGFGVQVPAAADLLRVDYAFGAFGVLGAQHRFTFGYQF